MALLKNLGRRLTGGYWLRSSTLQHPPRDLKVLSPSAVKTEFQEYLTSPGYGGRGFLRRFLHRSVARIPSEVFSVPVGEKLRETLRDINFPSERISLDGLAPPCSVAEESETRRRNVEKILKVYQMEKVKSKLREIRESSISHSDFVGICVGECEDEERGLELAKILDKSGTVIVLGEIVCLRPDMFAKSVERLISQALHSPNDPRRKELEKLEEEKAVIDEKAKALVRTELYGGLGFLVVQTLGFMRLTFWELSWDVMEPICFFVTSLDFALGYVFFLGTSTEPTFEGYFRRRMESKQRKLMEKKGFDFERYQELREVFGQNRCRSCEAGWYCREPGRAACIDG